MGTLLLILFVLSVPVFYIIGAIDFFKTIFGKKNGPLNKHQFLKQVVEETSEFADKNPHASLSDLLTHWKHQLTLSEKTQTQHVSTETSDTPREFFASSSDYEDEPIIPNEDIPSHHEHQEHPKHIAPEPDFFQNWYHDNSINLLLYVGAFLIVASASIFVGFQWETIQGGLKAILLTILTLSFLISGFIFFKNPKVKNAGVTFSAIGALLVPLAGLGWHNFVLKDFGLSLGFTWLLTSLIALATYIFLGLYFKNKFYGYITSLALWSLSLSFVSLSNLDDKFYILASILSNFLILGFHLIVRDRRRDLKDVFSEPLEISTNVLMPLTLAFGLNVAIAGSLFFSVEVALSLFLASCYYYLFYSFTQKEWQLCLSLAIFPLFLFSLFGWQNALDYRFFYAEIVLAFADLGIAYIMLKNKLVHPAWISTSIASFLAIISSLALIAFQYGPYYSLSASLILILFGFTTYFVHQKEHFLHISSVSVLLLIYIFFHDIIGLTEKEYLLGIIYLIIGFASFIATWLIKDSNKGKLTIVGLASFLSFLVSFPFCTLNEYTLLIALFSYSAAIHGASYRFKLPTLLFLSNIVLTVALHQTITLFKIDYFYRPFIFSTLALVLYGTSFIFQNEVLRADRFKLSGLALAIFVPLFYGLQSTFNGIELEKSALITSFLATALFTYESIRNKDQNITYATYAIAAVTALWLLKFLPSTDYLILFLTIASAAAFAVASLLSLSKERNPLFVYISNVFFAIAVIQIIYMFKVDQIYQPVIFAGLSIGLYFLNLIFPQYPENQQNYKYSGLALSLSTPIFFGLQSIFSDPLLETSALISSYLTVALFGFEAAKNENERFRYFCSSLVLILILWQIKVLQFVNPQAFCFPLGLYFLGLAYTRKIKKDQNGEEILNVIGASILILTSLVQAFSPNGALYALLLGLEGIALLLAGISLNNKLFRFSGILAIVLAVISQTYSYIFSLDRWIITGIAGLAFLGVAVFLLVKRSDGDHPN